MIDGWWSVALLAVFFLALSLIMVQISIDRFGYLCYTVL